MARLLILTNQGETEVLPALGLLSHQARQVPARADRLAAAPDSDAVIVDGRGDLAAARSLCKILHGTDPSTPLFIVLTEGGLSVVNADWGIHDVLLAGIGPAELDARLRLALGRAPSEPAARRIQTSGVTIDETSYSARVQGRALDLTYKEFELLRFFVGNPGRVFTREQLLSEVWGYDYFGGTRTVDVHIRRLRAKLGDMEQLIVTIRNVGYRFNLAEDTPEETS
ncbi:winged helix-turn-helix transcriptional regulator [Mycetocola spongiae]|uniref:winged helix-turn-helix transcriptional regulator n=1 Tax=Mycetocola spongiae TaxID=2859226 RepID=UPI001CF1D29A|nr:response regulator transcription factor [Mycetocola spongiae]UCR88766.1 response regulator transcription factor [Mycetocola spongiae]